MGTHGLMNWTTNEIIEALVDVWPGITVHKAVDGTSQGTCIETVRWAIEPLKKLGVRAEPLPCAVWCGNREAFEQVEAGVPVSEWPETAHSLGVDPNRRQPGENREQARARRKGWDGHLILTGRYPDTIGDEWWVLDLTAGQFARPDYGIDINTAVFGRDLMDDPREHAQRVNQPGYVLEYYPRPDLRKWKVTSAWRQDVPEFVTNTIAAKIRGVLTAAGGGGGE